MGELLDFKKLQKIFWSGFFKTVVTRLKSGDFSDKKIYMRPMRRGKYNIGVFRNGGIKTLRGLRRG